MLELIVLAIVQGIAEFLPISSSGHLSVLQHAFGMKDSQKLDLFLHIPTFLAIVVYFRQPLRETLALGKPENRILVSNLIAATFVTAAVYFTFRTRIDDSFNSLVAIGFGFLATTTILLLTLLRRDATVSDQITIWIALAAGLAQGAAIFPGVSRSGSTIACLVLFGIAPARAGYFSMLMFLPAIVGGTVIKREFAMDLPYTLPQLTVAFLVTFTVSYVALAFLMRFLRAGRLHHFAAWTFLMFVSCMIMARY